MKHQQQQQEAMKRDTGKYYRSNEGIVGLEEPEDGRHTHYDEDRSAEKHPHSGYRIPNQDAHQYELKVFEGCLHCNHFIGMGVSTTRQCVHVA
jgi:hypothetical protein